MTLFAQALDMSGMFTTETLLSAVIGFGLAMLKARFPNLPLPSPVPAPAPAPLPTPAPEMAKVEVVKLADAALEQIKVAVKEVKP